MANKKEDAAMEHRALKEKWDALCNAQAEDWLALSVCNSAQAICAMKGDAEGRDRAVLEGEKIYGRIIGRNKDAANLILAMAEVVDEQQDTGGISVLTADKGGLVFNYEGGAPRSRHERLLAEHGATAAAQFHARNGDGARAS